MDQLASMTCRACRAALAAESAFCHKCGAKVDTGPARPVRRRKAEMNESERLLKTMRGFDSLAPLALQHPTCAELWTKVPGAKGLIAMLEAAGYNGDLALRGFVRGVVGEAVDGLTDRRPSEALSTLDAYLAGRADDFDLRNAWARANSAAMKLVCEQADQEIAPGLKGIMQAIADQERRCGAKPPSNALLAAQAVAAVVYPRWYAESPQYPAPLTLEVALDALGRMAGARSASADRLRAALGNPFAADPALGIPAGDKHRKVETWMRKQGGKYQVMMGRNLARLTFHLPGEPLVEETFSTSAKAQHRAYTLMTSIEAPKAAGTRRRAGEG